MRSVLEKAKDLTRSRLEAGGWAVDATLGNGYDAVHLARCVGPDGRVIGFDCQEEAVARSGRRLERAGLSERVKLVRAGHEQMRRHVPEEAVGRIGAVMFNLGYLPGGDHSVITRPRTTIGALDQATDLLRPGGIATVVLYRGHEGGEAEYTAVRSWAARTDQNEVSVLHYHFLNQRNQPPELLTLEKVR